MIEPIKISGLKKTDCVFECDTFLIKARVEKKSILSGKRGPEAIAYLITCSVCDKHGKALKLDDGFYIMPHTVTFDLMNSVPDYDVGKGLREEVVKLVEQTARWYKAKLSCDVAYKEWLND